MGNLSTIIVPVKKDKNGNGVDNKLESSKWEGEGKQIWSWE
jgi:hypothetical protein